MGSPFVNQPVYRAELLAVTLALERLRGSGRVVSECHGVVRVVAALGAKVRPPRGKHIDVEKRILRVGWWDPGKMDYKAHTSEAQRRTLGLADEDVVGNDRADVVGKWRIRPDSSF